MKPELQRLFDAAQAVVDNTPLGIRTSELPFGELRQALLAARNAAEVEWSSHHTVNSDYLKDAMTELLLKSKETFPGLGCTVFVFNYGGGNLAYGSTSDRTSMISSIVEFLIRPENYLIFQNVIKDSK